MKSATSPASCDQSSLSTKAASPKRAQNASPRGPTASLNDDDALRPPSILMTSTTVSESDPFSVNMLVDAKNHRFPYCIVWTPLPMLSWILPFIGHMGIASSRGIIRDFAGPYYVAEDDMGFGWPSMYWQLDPSKVIGGAEVYDRAVRDASDEYKLHDHNIFCDNCHSHVALALNSMVYDGKSNWNMVNLAFYILFHGKFVGVTGFLKQYLPLGVILTFALTMIFIVPRLSTHGF